MIGVPFACFKTINFRTTWKVKLKFIMKQNKDNVSHSLVPIAIGRFPIEIEMQIRKLITYIQLNYFHSIKCKFPTENKTKTRFHLE